MKIFSDEQLNEILSDAIESYAGLNKLAAEAQDSGTQQAKIVEEQLDPQTSFRLCNAIAKLPQYEAVKEELRSASGVVNFVTGSQLPKIVDIFLKDAIPPSAIYGMGADPRASNYEVNARNYLGHATPLSDKYYESIDMLRDTIQGSKAKFSMSDFEEADLDPDLAKELFGVSPPTPGQGNSGVRGLGQEEEEEQAPWAQYTGAMIQFDSLKEKLDKMKASIEKKGDEIAQMSEEIRAFQEEGGKSRDLGALNEKIEKAKRAREKQMNLWREMNKTVQAAAKAITLNQDFPGHVIREDDGFIQYNPVKDILPSVKKLKVLAQKGRVSTAAELSTVGALKEIAAKVNEIESCHTDVLNAKSRLLTILGFENGRYSDSRISRGQAAKKAYDYLARNGSKVVDEIADIEKLLAGQGHVIIMSQLENSCLVTPGGKFLDDGVLLDFHLENASNEENNMSSRLEKGHQPAHSKLVLIKSRKPIDFTDSFPDGLQPKVIDLGKVPVDSEEAKIIVDHIFASSDLDTGAKNIKMVLQSVSEKYAKLFKAWQAGGTEAIQIDPSTYDYIEDPQERATTIAVEDMLLSQLRNTVKQKERVGEAEVRSEFEAAEAKAKKYETEKLKQAYALPTGRNRPSQFHPEMGLRAVDRTSRQKIEAALIGLSTTEALFLLLNNIRRGDVWTETNSPYTNMPIGLNINVPQLTYYMVDAVNKSSTNQSKGLKLVNTFLSFDQYAYNEKSDWAGRVGDIAFKAQVIELRKKAVDEKTRRINDLTRKLYGRQRDPSNPEQFVTVTAEQQQAIRDQIEKLKDDIEKIEMGIESFMNSIPHVFLLYGPPGTGKSIWAEALADMFDLRLWDMDIAKTKSKWLGETGANVDNMLESVLASKNAVFRIDEFDTQVQGGGDDGGGTGTSIAQETEGKLMNFLESRETHDAFIENTIFLVVTTNRIGKVRDAIKSRLKRGTFLIDLPEDPKAYLKVINSMMKVFSEKYSKHPFYSTGSERDAAACWEAAQDVLDQVNWEQIAEKMAKARLDFRMVQHIFEDLLEAHRSYVESIQLIEAQGGVSDVVQPRGVKLTTENVEKYVDMVLKWKESGGNPQNEPSVWTLERNKMVELRDIFDEQKARDGKMYIDEEIEMAIDGKIPQEEEEAIAIQRPTREEIERRQKGFPGEAVQELPKTLQEQEQELSEEAIQDITDEEEESEELGASASSNGDYLYKFLQKKGIVSSDGEIINKKKVAQTNDEQVVNSKPKSNTIDDSGFNGCYYGVNEQGQEWLFIGPRTANTPSQYI